MKFEKVSPEQFAADCDAAGFAVEYANVVMPKRATKGSAGYDICCPFDVVLAPHTSVKVPTGVRITDMPKNCFMGLYISWHACIDKNIELVGGVQIVDEDSNIWLYLRNNSDVDTTIISGEKIGNGVFHGFRVMHFYDKDET